MASLQESETNIFYSELTTSAPFTLSTIRCNTEASKIRSPLEQIITVSTSALIQHVPS